MRCMLVNKHEPVGCFCDNIGILNMAQHLADAKREISIFLNQFFITAAGSKFIAGGKCLCPFLSFRPLRCLPSGCCIPDLGKGQRLRLFRVRDVPVMSGLRGLRSSPCRDTFLRKSFLNRPDKNILNKPLVQYPHFPLGRMNIYVHESRVYLKEKYGNRVTVTLLKFLIGPLKSQ